MHNVGTLLWAVGLVLSVASVTAIAGTFIRGPFVFPVKSINYSQADKAAMLQKLERNRPKLRAWFIALLCVGAICLVVGVVVVN